MNYRGKALGSFRVLIEPPLPGEVKTSLREADERAPPQA